MMSYLEIANRINDEKQSDPELDWIDELDIADAPNFKEPPLIIPSYSTVNGAERKWRDGLSKILTFVNRYENVQITKRCPLINTSTRGKLNSYIWGSHTSVGNAINNMIEMGLISVNNGGYSFNCGKQNTCREFRFFRGNVEKFKVFCEDNNIKPFVIKDYEYDETEMQNGKSVAEFNRKKVLFKSNLRLSKPNTKSEKEFEAFLTTCLYENYPQFKFYEDLVKEINGKYYSGYLKDFAIVFEPKYRWSGSRKNITSIGIRATTSKNNTKKANRQILFDEYGLNKNKDITASVPRVTLSINNGEWLSKEVDLYEEIYSNCHQDEPFTEEMRKAIKKLFMRAYFDSTEKNMVHHTWKEMDKEGIKKEEIDEPMRKLRNAIKETCGKIYKKEIFLAESCIYLRVLQRLLESGRRCWLLYDCFYSSGFEGETDEEYSQIIDEYLVESFNEYMSRSKKRLR